MISQINAFSIQNSVVDGNLSSEPFKHIVIDNFLPVDVAKGLLSAFPPADDNSWDRTDDAGIEIKARSTWSSEFDIPDGLVDIIRVFNSAPILTAMSAALEIPKLMSDPYYAGGGLNLSERNGLLDVHGKSYHEYQILHIYSLKAAQLLLNFALHYHRFQIRLPSLAAN